jgi:ornithine carbamoyltransferase
MTIRHVLSISELGAENLAHLIDRGLALVVGDGGRSQPLSGRVVGIYFRGPSTRTRTSFTVAAFKLGADVIAYGPRDLQLSTGETLRDTARVLSSYLDALVIRTNEPVAEMRALAEPGEMSIINAMSDNEHPTQAVADMVTMKEEFGRLEDLHVLYVGEGNNTAASLALAVAQTPGMRLTLATPEGYGLAEDILTKARDFSARYGGAVEERHGMSDLPRGVDVVYTTRWQTMGETKPDPNWRASFEPYTVTSELMARVSKPARTIFLHDLPAVRGADVTDEVLDGPQSRAFRQARHKLTGAMAVLEWCLAG